jgi:ariadne-1
MMSESDMEEEAEDYIYESDADHSDSNVNASFGSSRTHASQTSHSAVPFTVLNQAAVKREQDRVIAEIGELFSTSAFESRRLLMEFRWEKEELTNAMFIDGVEVLLKRAGVPRAVLPAPGTAAAAAAAAAAAGPARASPSECLICADALTPDTALTNGSCGHTFCRTCWTGHARVQIQENLAARVRCMMEKCSVLVSPDVMARLALAPAEADRYERSLLDSFVEDNPRVTWCPSQPCCGRALRVSDTSTTRIDCECLCEEVFCFSCESSSHSPAPCEWAKQWLALCARESASAMYIAINCKPCPKCGKSIAKADGCNHVTCTCGQSLCWLCGAATGRAHDYSSILGHTCGKFRLDARTDAAKARQSLEKYVHYFSRYDAHMKSLGEANKVKSHVDLAVAHLESAANNNSLADWLWIGLYQLLRMRRFVAWTYAFAFYAFYDTNLEKLKAAAKAQDEDSGAGGGGSVLHVQELFEDLQAVLERSVESLSKFVETPPAEVTADTKTNVLNLCSATHQNAMAFTDFVSNDLFANGILGLDDPPTYFPIRRMQIGLGVKASMAQHQQQHQQRPMRAPAALPVPFSPMPLRSGDSARSHPSASAVQVSSMVVQVGDRSSADRAPAMARAQAGRGVADLTMDRDGEDGIERRARGRKQRKVP